MSNAALEKIYDDRRLFGHPVGLGVLFLTEMWERFSYYGMRGLLKLYMVNYLFVVSRQIVQGGDAMAPGDPNAVIGWNFIRNLIDSDPTTPVGAHASVLYGWYTGLVYATPILGGYLADRYWGQRKTVILGGALTDPFDTGLLLFLSIDKSTADAFAQADPYVTNGLVERYEVRHWITVAGPFAAEPV